MQSSSTTELNPLAGLVACVFPGAGHLVLGQRKRGVLAMVGVMGLFFFGLLIGGIDAIDSKENRVWFYGQMLVGPSTIVVDQIHQKNFKAYDLRTGALRNGYPGEHRVEDGSRAIWQPLTQAQIESGMGPPNLPGLGRLNEIAMLSIVLAGMLNLIVVIDALVPNPKHMPGWSGHQADDSAKGGAE